jgi:uncharacterized membrane protein
MGQTKISINRHLLKTLTYRILSSFIGFLILFITTKNLKISISFSLAEFLFKPVIYFIHERVWYKWIKFGVIQIKDKVPNYSQFEDTKISTNREIPYYQEETPQIVPPKPKIKRLNYTKRTD